MTHDVKEPIIEIKNLCVKYGKGKKQFTAVDDISFNIRRGEVVGFIGPNGAGKTSTIKAIMGFIFPSSGSIKVFGKNAGNVESRMRMGYLPEVSLYYPYMKSSELLELYGGLQGLSGAELKKRIPEVLDLVGLGDKTSKKLLKDFSKGMQQRLGIAQAIIADPELLIFDEMSSGLDPVGRFDLRQVLLDLKNKGRTIFFSSHELMEVENLCSKIIIINKGKIRCEGTVDDLLRPMNSFDIEFTLHDKSQQLPQNLKNSCAVTRDGEIYKCKVEGIDNYTNVLRMLSEQKADIIETKSKKQSLEDFFIELINSK